MAPLPPYYLSLCPPRRASSRRMRDALAKEKEDEEEEESEEEDDDDDDDAMDVDPVEAAAKKAAARAARRAASKPSSATTATTTSVTTPSIPPPAPAPAPQGKDTCGPAQAKGGMLNPVWRLIDWRSDMLVGDLPLALARLAWAFAALDVRSPQVLKTVERLHPLLTRKCAVPAAEAVKAEAAAKAAEKVMAQRARALGAHSNSPAGAAGSSSSTPQPPRHHQVLLGCAEAGLSQGAVGAITSVSYLGCVRAQAPPTWVLETRARRLLPRRLSLNGLILPGSLRCLPRSTRSDLPHRSNATRCGYLVECLVEHTKVKDRQDKERMEAEAKAKRAAEAEKEGGEGAAEAMAVEAKEKERRRRPPHNGQPTRLFEGTALVYLRERITSRVGMRSDRLYSSNCGSWTRLGGRPALCPTTNGCRCVRARRRGCTICRRSLAAAVAPRPEMQAVAAREAALAREHAAVLDNSGTRGLEGARAALKEAEACGVRRRRRRRLLQLEEAIEAKADAMAEAMAKAWDLAAWRRRRRWRPRQRRYRRRRRRTAADAVLLSEALMHAACHHWCVPRRLSDRHARRRLQR